MSELPKQLQDIIFKQTETQLTAKVVRGHNFEEEDDGESLAADFETTGFQASHLNKAIKLINEMCQKRKNGELKIVLSLSKNLLATGLRDSITYLAQNQLFDALFCNGVEYDFLRSMTAFYAAKDFSNKFMKGNQLQINQLGKGASSRASSHSEFQADTSIKKDIKLDYKLTKILGSGAFGIIREATRIGSSDKKYAVKTLYKREIKCDLLKNEIELMKALDHPNIVKYYASYEDQQYFHIVMELCTGGELFGRILKTGGLKEQQAKQIFKQMLGAVKHMHAKNIVHRDIKPENFLFENAQSDVIKLIDFGIASKFIAGKLLKNTRGGTINYSAPEVFLSKYKPACDLWALGITLFTMLSAQLPFDGNSDEEIIQKIKNSNVEFRNRVWNNVSKEAKSLINSLLAKEPKNRITIDQALQHPWLQQEQNSEQISEQAPEVLENLLNYRADKILKTQAMHVLVAHADQSHIKGLQKIFQAMDKENTGMVTSQDLFSAMQQCGMNVEQEQIQQIIEQLDVHGTGYLNYSEFLAATLDAKIYMDEQMLLTAFSYFDVEKTGFITAQNLEKALLELGREFKQEEIQQMIDNVDQNKDGRISFQDFKYMMDPKLESQQSQSHIEENQPNYRVGNVLIPVCGYKNLVNWMIERLDRQKENFYSPLELINFLAAELSDPSTISFQCRLNNIPWFAPCLSTCKSFSELIYIMNKKSQLILNASHDIVRIYDTFES